MSNYLALARKYRPRTFDDVVGQSNILTAIKNSLDSNRLHHAYLLTGTRGVGKTTLARLFAKSLNCEKGVSSTPCGCCDACRSIDEGSFIDLIEIDAASKTKVEDTRAILENISYKPTSGRYKVYIIDEVHMLSKASFNALLKTLEEPPEYVKFILATTDPQNIPVTIVSRCLQFKLQNLTPSLISARLSEIFRNENIRADARSIQIIAEAAAGSMRDALSIADQAIALTNGDISSSALISMLGVIDTELYRDTLMAVHRKNYEELYALLEKIDSYSPNYESIINALANLIHEISMFQVLGDRININFRNPVETLRTFAAELSPEVLQIYYQILLIGRKDLAYAPNGRVAFDMTLLRMITFAEPSQKVPVQQIGGVIRQPQLQPVNAAATCASQSGQTSVFSSQKYDSNRETPAAAPAPAHSPAPAPVVPDNPLMADLNSLQNIVKARGSVDYPWDDHKPKIPLPEKGSEVTVPPMNDAAGDGGDIKKNSAVDPEPEIHEPQQQVSQQDNQAGTNPDSGVRQSLESDIPVNVPETAPGAVPPQIPARNVPDMSEVPPAYEYVNDGPQDLLPDYFAGGDIPEPDYSAEISMDSVIHPFSDREPVAKGSEAKRMFTYEGVLPFSDPDEYRMDRAIEYVTDPWWLMIKEQIHDDYTLMILKNSFLEKTADRFAVHISSQNLLMLSEQIRKEIREKLSAVDPAAKELEFVEDPDCADRCPNGLARAKYYAIKRKMAKQLMENKKFTEFIRYFGLTPDLDNLHLLRREDGIRAAAGDSENKGSGGDSGEK